MTGQLLITEVNHKSARPIQCNGKRRPAVTGAAPAEITPSTPGLRNDASGRSEAYYKLPYFDPKDGTPRFVDFR